MSDRFLVLLSEARNLPPEELRLLVEALEETIENRNEGQTEDQEFVQRVLKRKEELATGNRKPISRAELIRRVQANLE